MTPNSHSTTRTPAILRIIITVLALALWFWTQSLIGARTLPSKGIGDGLHQLTAPLNLYFNQSPRAANALLIVSSGFIDLLGIFLLGSWLLYGNIRPFLGLVILMALRQVMQGLCALPTPSAMVWHNPGFPSLLVTYHVANDYFFSGHTAIAVFAAKELTRIGKPWLTTLVICIVIFEMATVLILRAHYTMDVFTGFLAAFFASDVASALTSRFGVKG